MRARKYPLKVVTRKAKAVSVAWWESLRRDWEMRKKRPYGWKQAPDTLLSVKTLAEEGGLVYPYSAGKEISNYCLNCFSY